MFRTAFFSVLIVALFWSCTDNSQKITEQFETRSKQIKKTLVKDKALEVFNFNLSKDTGWVLEGETTLETAAEHIRHLADSLLGSASYTNKIKVLPDPALGDSIYGVVIVSVTPFRRGAKHASEMVDQVIMGNRLELLQKHKGWYLAKNHYGYIGWINKTAFARMDKTGLQKWKNGNLQQVTALNSFVYEKPNEKSEHLADLVLNASMIKIAKKGNWVKVQLADGEEGWVLAKDLTSYFENLNPEQIKIENIIKTARSLLGIPYLWGGKSTKACDCSGFTQTTFRANGMQLPRDASQQVHLGEEVVPTEDFSNVKAGDLVFFGVGKRITHVGLSLGGYEFIHQDSDVHIDSFNPKAENFNAFRKRSLKKIKRVL